MKLNRLLTPDLWNIIIIIIIFWLLLVSGFLLLELRQNNNELKLNFFPSLILRTFVLAPLSDLLDSSTMLETPISLREKTQWTELKRYNFSTMLSMIVQYNKEKLKACNHDDD